MASGKHVRILRKGVDRWNRWRERNLEVRPDLSKAYLDHQNLSNAILWNCNLDNTILAGSILVGAQLNGASLRGTELRRADLRDSILVGANLIRTDLYHARLDEAILHSTVLVSLDLSRTEGLSKAVHLGPSAIGADTIEMTSHGLSEEPVRRDEIESFYRQAGVPDHLMAGKHSNNSGKIMEFYSCFISYSHTDTPLARRLYGELKKSDIRCWLDEHDLKPGDRILNEVGDAIRAHDRILLCCSEASLNSWWVRDEIHKALERERRDGRDIIIPLMVDRYVLDSWEDGLAADLRSRLAADFTGWEHDNTKFEEQFKRVVKALRADPRSKS